MITFLDNTDKQELINKIDEAKNINVECKCADVLNGKDVIVKMIAGRGYVTSSGKFQAGANSESPLHSTDYISTAGYDTVEYYSGVVVNAFVVAFYDDDKNLMMDESIRSVSGGTVIGGVPSNSGTVEIPKDASYVMLSGYGSHWLENGYIKLTGKGLLNEVETLKTDIKNVTVKSPLKDKRIAMLGDSISYREWYQGYHYAELIENKTGCTFIDYGVSSSRIADREADTVDSFVERFTAMDDTADAVIVMGGTNDFNTIQLGETDSTDTTTFYGALNTLIAGLISKYAGKPIIFFAPIKTANTTYTLPPSEYEIKQMSATEKVTANNLGVIMSMKCRQYGIKFVDLASETGVNGYDTDKVYFKTDDSLHPTELGMRRIANVVHHELEKVFTF